MNEYLREREKRKHSKKTIPQKKEEGKMRYSFQK